MSSNVVSRKPKHRTSTGQSEFVTLTLTYNGIKTSRQALPRLFMETNRMTKPGMITLLGKDGSKTMIRLYRDSKERMSFGKGWRDFALVNGIRIGESFKLEAVWEETTPMLKLYTMESKNDKKRMEERGTSSSVLKLTSMDSNKDKKKMEEGNPLSLVLNNRTVTLELTYKVLKDSTLVLPSDFMTSNGIEKVGKIGFVGRANTNWWGYLSQSLESVAVGIGWENFCKFNGVEEGDSFTLEFFPEDQSQFPVLMFSPTI